MINLSSRDCNGAFVYNDELYNYIVTNGKPITEITELRDSSNKNVSPLIALCHVPTKKVNAYKSWYWFKYGCSFSAVIHTESGLIKPNNDDFMYLVYADDYRIQLPNKEIIIYDETVHLGIGKYKNFSDEKIHEEFLNDRKNFNSGYTLEEQESNWYKKFTLLN